MYECGTYKSYCGTQKLPSENKVDLVQYIISLPCSSVLLLTGIYILYIYNKYIILLYIRIRLLHHSLAVIQHSGLHGCIVCIQKFIYYYIKPRIKKKTSNFSHICIIMYETYDVSQYSILRSKPTTVLTSGGFLVTTSICCHKYIINTVFCILPESHYRLLLNLYYLWHPRGWSFKFIIKKF